MKKIMLGLLTVLIGCAHAIPRDSRRTVSSMQCQQIPVGFAQDRYSCKTMERDLSWIADVDLVKETFQVREKATDELLYSASYCFTNLGDGDAYPSIHVFQCDQQNGRGPCRAEFYPPTKDSPQASAELRYDGNRGKVKFSCSLLH